MRLTNTLRDAFVHTANGMSTATTDEIERRIGYRIPSPHIDLLLGYIAEREAAVLAKLEGQEPVAMRYDFDGYGYKYIDSGSGSDWRSRIPDAEAVYAAPQQADRQRVPDGWKLVPVEPGEWVFADKVLGHDSHPNHKERMRRLYRAMLAAAPEAPAQAEQVAESMPLMVAQALEALDELEAAARGDEPFNHFAAPLIRQTLKHYMLAAAPDAPATAVVQVPQGWRLEVDESAIYHNDKRIAVLEEDGGNQSWRDACALGQQIVDRMNAAHEAPVHADRQQGPEADHVVTQTCTDERPCIPCFTDNGLCAALATPEATAQEKSNG